MNEPVTTGAPRKLPVLFDCPLIKVKLRPEVCGRRWALAHDRVKAHNAQDRALAKQVMQSPCRTCTIGEQNLTATSEQPVGPQAVKGSAIHAPKRRGRPPKAKPVSSPAPAAPPASRAPTVRAEPPARAEPQLPIAPPEAEAVVVVVPKPPAVPKEVRPTRERPPPKPGPAPQLPKGIRQLDNGWYEEGGRQFKHLPADRLRHQVATPLTDAEYAQLKKLAAGANTSVAKWLRPHVLAAIERGQAGVVAVGGGAVGLTLDERINLLDARVRKLEGGQ